MRQLQTDVGPEWIGAPSIWDGSATPSGEGTKGEGVVAGILDSGLNAANPSFADAVPEADGGDGYVLPNPLVTQLPRHLRPGQRRASTIADFGCNDKLIGAWDFAPGDDADPWLRLRRRRPRQPHRVARRPATRSTRRPTAPRRPRPTGSRPPAPSRASPPTPTSSRYDVCDDGCPLTAIIAGIDQAIDDGVDVINYSIGSAAASNPWSDPDALGFLNARAAGIHVATSAGNDGPGAATARLARATSRGSPRSAPPTHNRQWQRHRRRTSPPTARPPSPTSRAWRSPTPPTGRSRWSTPPTLGSNLPALADELDGRRTSPARSWSASAATTAASRRAQVVAALGAEGMILINDQASGNSLNADPHALPAVAHHLRRRRRRSRQWMDTVTGRAGLAVRRHGVHRRRRRRHHGRLLQPRTQPRGRDDQPEPLGSRRGHPGRATVPTTRSRGASSPAPRWPARTWPARSR